MRMSLLTTALAIGLTASGCSTPKMPDPHMTPFVPQKHAKVGTVHGIRGTLHKDGKNWQLRPNSNGTYLCIKVEDYRRIKQACNDTLTDLKRCSVINDANVRKCNAVYEQYGGG